MQKKPIKSLANMDKNFTEILGTRYYRIAILDNREDEPQCIVTAFLQTPLSPAELQQFVTNRVGKGFTVIATTVSKERASRSDESTSLMPLCTMESMLKPYVPEVITEVTYAKIVKTTKGTEIQMPVDPETGEIIEKKVGK